MYIHNIPLKFYSDPWVSDFTSRLKKLDSNGINVVYYYEKPDSSTFRYRVYNMIQALESSTTKVFATFFWGDELDQLDKIISKVNVIVICRSRYTEKINRFITAAQNKGIIVFFDIDDLVFNPIYTHMVVDSLNYDFENQIVSDFWFSFIGKQAATLNLCDHVITTNNFLADCIRQFINKKVYVIPNFFNQEQEEISNQIFQSKVKNDFLRNEKFHIGYFSGSPTHTKDFAIVQEALTDLLAKYENLVLRVVGYMDLDNKLKKFSSQIERYPMQDFVNLQRIIGDVEVNIVPLQDNDFTNCKSELKYFEAGIGGTVTIASPTYTYQQAITDGVNGFLAFDYQWYEKIEYLINNPSYLNALGHKANILSLDRYSWRNFGSIIQNMLT